MTVGLLCVACEPDREPQTPTRDPEWRVQVGDTVPEVVLMTTQAEKVRMSDHRGKVVVLNFFATWCGPCHSELASMQKLLAPVAKVDDRLVLLTVAVSQTRKTVEYFLEDADFEWPFLLDINRKMLDTYCTSGAIPRMMVIDHEGKAASLHVGFSPRSMAQIAAQVNSLLAKIPAETTVAAEG